MPITMIDSDTVVKKSTSPHMTSAAQKVTFASRASILDTVITPRLPVEKLGPNRAWLRDNSHKNAARCRTAHWFNHPLNGTARILRVRIYATQCHFDAEAERCGGATNSFLPSGTWISQVKPSRAYLKLTVLKVDSSNEVPNPR
jgi:hypothetical protein